jgi:hypothetical protein
MDTVCRIITALGALLILAMTVWGIFSARRERRITAFSSFTSAALSFILLPVFILLVDVRPNFWVSLLVLGLGLLAGCLGGVTAQLSYRDGHVMGRNSWLFLLLWGGSLVLAQVLNLFGSAALAAIGLLPMFLTTGAQVGRDGTILVRRSMIKRPLAGPSSDRIQPTRPSFLPEALPGQVGGRGQRIPPRFAEVERRFFELRARYQAGWMDDAAYNAALQGLMIDDGAGGFWVPADERGGWYWYNGREWVRRDPGSC